MESNTQRRAAGLRDKIPDIQKTLETVRFLKSRKVCAYAYLCRRHDAKFGRRKTPIRSRQRSS